MAELAGLWAGRFRTSEGDEPLVVRVAADDGAVDLSARLLFGAPITSLEHSGADVGLDATAAELVVRARLVPSGDAMAGTASIGGAGGDVQLHRVDTGADLGRLTGEYQLGARSLLIARIRDRLLTQTVHFYAEDDALVRLYPVRDGTLLSERGESFAPAPGGGLVCRTSSGDQVAQRARPYESTDVTFKGRAGRLAASLLTPADPRGAVVMLHGTIPAERDYYRVFARHFARHGIASLIWDRRGNGDSEGSPESTILDRADDAAAGIAWLRDRGFARIGVWAFSNGGWSAPVVARRDPDLAFLIGFGTSGVTMADAEVHRRVSELRLAGVSERSLEAVAECWRLIFGYVARGSLSEAERVALDEALAAVHADRQLGEVPVPEFAQIDPALAAVPQWAGSGELPPIPEPDAEIAYDPCADYARVEMPVLFVIGQRDQNIPPDASAARVRAALEAAGNDRSRAEIIPGAGHELNVEPPPEARAPLFSFQRFRFAPALLDRVAVWAAGQLEP